MSVLVISTSQNDHAAAVQAAVERRGIEVVRLNMDSLTGANAQVSFFSPSSNGISIAGKHIRPDSVTGVFVHHPHITINQSLGLDDLDRGLAESGWRNALDWILQVFAYANWINRPDVSRSSSGPCLQLSVASKHGLRVPDTCFTNNAETLRKFASRHSSILLKSGPLLGVRLREHRLLSNLIDVNTIEPDALASSPCYFQEYIDKDYELRLHVFSDTILSCRIESQKCKATQVDWRNYQISDTPHFSTEISTSLSDSCRQILASLGLTYGIMDLIVTPEGEAVFLECNSQGHWLWIEELTGLPITESVVKHLV